MVKYSYENNLNHIFVIQRLYYCLPNVFFAIFVQGKKIGHQVDLEIKQTPPKLQQCMLVPGVHLLIIFKSCDDESV